MAKDGEARAEHIVRVLGGRASFGEVLSHTTEHELRSALAQGRIRKVRRGVYALPELPEPLAMATRLSGRLSHLSAAEHWELPTLLPADAVHVMVPPRSSRRVAQAGVVLHYADPGRTGTATSVLRTVLDCAATLPVREALAVADSALRLELLRPAELRAAAAAHPPRGRRRVRQVADHADGRAANPFESALRAVLVEAGIRGFSPQLKIREGSFSATVDLGDAGRMIVLEADSFAHHGSRKALHRDCWRNDELISRDWLVLRFSWEHVMFHPSGSPRSSGRRAR